MPLPMEATPLLYDSFNLVPGENPLRDSGKWGEYSTRPPLMAHNPTGNSIHGTVEFAVNGSLFKQQVFSGPIIEGYGCTPISGLGAALESNRIVALYGDPNSYAGYSSGYGGGIGESYFFRRYDASGPGSFTSLGEVSGTPPDKLGIRITPTNEEQWAYYSGAWHLIQSFSDGTHRGPVRFALETEEQGGIEEVAWTCFHAGVINRTQIYRIVRALA